MMRGILFLLVCSCFTLLDLPRWVVIAFCVVCVLLGVVGFVVVAHEKWANNTPSLGEALPGPSSKERWHTTQSQIKETA